jgi:hypothetical protein
VEVPWPVRGTAGGWRDWFDDDDAAQARAQVEADHHSAGVGRDTLTD